MNADVRRARSAFVWVGVIAPAAILVLAAILVAAWLPDIPEPAAIHWGPGGVDGFGPGWTYLALPLGLGGLFVALFAVMAFFAHRPRASTADSSPTWSGTARLLGAASLALAVMMALTSLIAVGVQRGLDDAADAPDITPSVLLGLGVMAAVAVLGWLVQPRAQVDPDAGASAEPLALAGSERAVWMGTAATAKSGQVVLGISVFSVLAISVLMGATGVEGWWLTGIIGVLLAVLVVTMLVFRVHVSGAGLRVRSVAGWPRFFIPAAKIESVRVVQIDPFAEFGGWGYRIGTDGRRGLVLRRGEALQIEQRRGKPFVVTVDDAETAASVLAVAARRATEAGA
ncbi:DUF1648 domain-containing protein [Microbacterium sp. NPDC055903]